MQMSVEIKIEAMRIARDIIRNHMINAGYRLCNYKAQEITEACKVLIADSQEHIIPKAWDICKMRWEAARHAS